MFTSGSGSAPAGRTWLSVDLPAPSSVTGLLLSFLRRLLGLAFLVARLPTRIVSPSLSSEPLFGRSVPVSDKPPVRPLQNPRSDSSAYRNRTWPPSERTYARPSVVSVSGSVGVAVPAGDPDRFALCSLHVQHAAVVDDRHEAVGVAGQPKRQAACRRQVQRRAGLDHDVLGQQVPAVRLPDERLRREPEQVLDRVDLPPRRQHQRVRRPGGDPVRRLQGGLAPPRQRVDRADLDQAAVLVRDVGGLRLRVTGVREPVDRLVLGRRRLARYRRLGRVGRLRRMRVGVAERVSWCSAFGVGEGDAGVPSGERTGLSGQPENAARATVQRSCELA